MPVVAAKLFRRACMSGYEEEEAWRQTPCSIAMAVGLTRRPFAPDLFYHFLVCDVQDSYYYGNIFKI